MSAETLRKAATLMRERAEAARESAPPRYDEETGAASPAEWYGPHAMSSRRVASVADSEHIASWHPAVALAVADWLDETALRWAWVEERELALAAARAYLRGDA